MARVSLETIALGRSGDKGDASNVGIIARSDAAYVWLREHMTARLVASMIPAIAVGRVERFEVPNLRALNFILHGSLGGGGTASLLTDAQGKSHAQALLRCQLDIPDEVVASVVDP
jgi:hypothetical protein